MGKKAEVATTIQMITFNITGVLAFMPFMPARIILGVLAGTNAVSGAITAFYAARTYGASEKDKEKLNKAIHNLQEALNKAMESREVQAHGPAAEACSQIHTALHTLRDTVNSSDFREITAEKDIPRQIKALELALKNAKKNLPKK